MKREICCLKLINFEGFGRFRKKGAIEIPKSVPSLYFFTFLYGFRYIKMLSIRHKTKTYFCKKVEKKSKIVKNLYISSFLGSSKRSLK